MTNLRKAALIITLQCIFISQFYLYFGGSTSGRESFRHFMNYVLPNEEDGVQIGGLILIVFAVPLLVAGAACILLLGSSTSSDTEMDKREVEPCELSPRSATYAPSDENFSKEGHGLLPTSKRKRRRPTNHNILSRPRGFAIISILVPCIFFYLCNISRHYDLYETSYNLSSVLNQTETTEQSYSEPNSTDYNQQVPSLYHQLLQHIANDSAMMALVSMSYLLVPISKHSPLVLLANWSPIEAVVIHKWAGRLGIIGVVIHGGLHLLCGYWRWWDALTRNAGYNTFYWRVYLPPWQCWKSVFFGISTTDEFDFGYGCYQETSSCQCHDFFLNFTGLIGMIALVVLGCSSVGYVRRHHYWLFYILHITAGPCFMIMTVLHYNKAILYLCPSLLYYASTSIPTYVQNWMQRSAHDEGTRLLSISKIPCPAPTRSDAAVWDVVFECTREAYGQFIPGQNCMLHVPQISAVAHPFTANKVHGYNDRLRLLIRETGSFTKQLGKCLDEHHRQSVFKSDDELESQLPSAQIPLLHISGFYGVTHRINQLRIHDNVIIIAGGIGITPYLSLLMDVVDSPSCLKEIELHWICRDMSLIQFIHEQYFSTMMQRSPLAEELSVKIIVHCTGSSPSSLDTKHFTPASPGNDGSYPMRPSYFTVATNQSTLQSKLAFMAFTSIFSLCLWLIWFFYARIQSQEEIATRVLSLLFVIGTSVCLSAGFLHIADTYMVKLKPPLNIPKSKNNYSSVIGSEQCNNCHVSYEQRMGRPHLNHVLRPLVGASNPAVFACGPRQLLESVRQNIDCRVGQLSFYEEVFEQ